MNNRFKLGLYIMGGVLILWVILNLAIKLFVWLLPFIGVLYIIYIAKRYIDKKRNKYLNNSKYNSKDKMEFIESYSDLGDDSISEAREVIEVEYKEVNK